MGIIRNGFIMAKFYVNKHFGLSKFSKFPGNIDSITNAFLWRAILFLNIMNRYEVLIRIEYNCYIFVILG